MTIILSSLLLAAIAAAPDAFHAKGGQPHLDPRTLRGARPASAALAADGPARRSRDIVVTVSGNVEGTVAAGGAVALGNVSFRPKSPSGASSSRRGAQGTVLRRVVTVRIGTDRAGFAPLRAYLQADDGRCRIRVDGKLLTAVPQLIDPLAPLGQNVTHVLEIEIPTTVTEGPVYASIGWTADAN